MAIHRLPVVGRVSLNQWDYLNLLLGLGLVLWSPLQQIVAASPPSPYLWVAMTAIGVGVWVMTLVKGRRTYHLFRALEHC